MKKFGLTAALALAALTFAADRAEAACGATVNGRPMAAETCRYATLIYGGVMPGNYVADNQGNWRHLETGRTGNTVADAYRNLRGTRYACGGNRSIMAQGRGASCGQFRSIFAEY